MAFVAILAVAASLTFYRDVLPILQKHCQACHREGQMAPMPLETYRQTRPYARAIAEAAATRKMPPWFADPCCGHFENDPSLSNSEIRTLVDWAEAKAPEGRWQDAPEPPQWTAGWNIDRPDTVLRMPVAKRLPSSGDVPYQYVIIPTGFKEDRWVRMSEIKPSNRMVVHHAVAYIRTPQSKWLRGAPVGKAFSADDLPNAALKRDATWTDSDILLVYAPGSQPDRWPAGYAKLIPAGSDIVLQMHYTARGAPMTDQTSIGIVWAKEPPRKRVLSLQLTNDRFLIPPGVPDYRVEVRGTLPNDAELLSFFPHMHLRGKSFEYRLIPKGALPQVLLKIPRYDFFWQLSYRLAQPIKVKAGTTLQATATFDNSRANRHNPDPDSAVRWGEQTWAEMMVGFFDVAVEPDIDKRSFFVRTR